MQAFDSAAVMTCQTLVTCKGRVGRQALDYSPLRSFQVDLTTFSLSTPHIKK
jgi:hypothetical protein